MDKPSSNSSPSTQKQSLYSSSSFISLNSLVPAEKPKIDQERPVLAQPQLIREIEEYIRQLNAELRAFITRYDNLTNEEEDAIDSSTIFYLPPNDVTEVLVEVHDVGPAKPTSIFEMSALTAALS